MRTVSLGTFSPSVLVEVAARTGALEHAGLAVQEIPATSSPAQFAALLDGELDAVLTNPDNVVAYRCLPDNPLSRTADVRILAAVDGGLGLSLFGQPGCTTPEQLRGGVLSVDAPTTGFAFIAYELLDQLGLHKDDGYSIQAMGSTPRRAEALLAGQCRMTVLNAGNDLRAEGEGATRLSSVTSIGPYVGTVLAARGDTIQREGEVLALLIETLLHTSAELVAGKHMELALDATQHRLGLDRTTAQRYLKTLVDPVDGLVADGRMSPDALQTVVGLRNRYFPGASTLTVEAVLDSGIVDDGLLPTS